MLCALRAKRKGKTARQKAALRLFVFRASTLLDRIRAKNKAGGELYYQVQHFREIKEFMQDSGRMELQYSQNYGGELHELQTS